MISFDTTINVLRALLDIVCVWGLIYLIINNMKSNARSLQLFKGVLAILVVKLITTIFNLTTLNYIVDLVINFGVLGIIIIFQPEIRSLLEKIGETRLRTKALSVSEIDKVVSELCDTIRELSDSKTGALITFERRSSLSEYITSGKVIDSSIKKELLLSIFYEGTSLHDGAVIIRGDRIMSAACFYPSTTQSLPTRYGARHRAAIGISEVTDALTVVVSEETGKVSFASHGVLKPIEFDDLRTSLIKEIDYFKGGD